MVNNIATSVLFLFIINLGIAFGAGLYEVRITLPQWLKPSQVGGYLWDAEAARQANVGLRFWVYVTTIPLTLLTLASLAIAWWMPDLVRNWWLSAATASLVDRGMTFIYFVPTMIKLMQGDGGSQAASKALQWARVGYIRMVANLVAWLAALMAFWLTSKYTA
jgi:hypothetical protein